MLINVKLDIWTIQTLNKLGWNAKTPDEEKAVGKLRRACAQGIVESKTTKDGSTK